MSAMKKPKICKDCGVKIKGKDYEGRCLQCRNNFRREYDKKYKRKKLGYKAANNEPSRWKTANRMIKGYLNS